MVSALSWGHTLVLRRGVAGASYDGDMAIAPRDTRHDTWDYGDSLDPQGDWPEQG